MKAVLQRVAKASVAISGVTVGAIDKGWLIFLGIGDGDTSAQIPPMVEKILGLRLFSDEAGKFNHSVIDIKGALLVVSQFTLYADCSRGRRPSFTKAGKPEPAKNLYEEFIRTCRLKNIEVATGEFGADMMVHIENDGPVTIVLDDREVLC